MSASSVCSRGTTGLWAFESATFINDYLPGQGIAPHTDRGCFGAVVATESLASAVNIDFCCRLTGSEHTLRLMPGSLLLFSGDARFKWHHGIAKRHYDTWNGHKIKRQRRVSITFRTIAHASVRSGDHKRVHD